MNNLMPIEHRNQRVLTTQQLAEAYETDDKKIRDNFTNNRQRYIHGKHYYKVEGEELQALKNRTEIFGVVGERASSVFLWTEKGAWLHAKSLNTDRAWEAYEMLVDTYYEMKDKLQVLDKLSPQLQLLINMEMEQKKIIGMVEETKQEVQAIRDTVVVAPDNWRKYAVDTIRKIGYRNNLPYEDITKLSYESLKQRAGCDLERRLKGRKERAEQLGVAKSKISTYNYLDCIFDDKKLAEIYLIIIKELAIKYNVA